jgi:hypothetical protein
MFLCSPDFCIPESTFDHTHVNMRHASPLVPLIAYQTPGTKQQQGPTQSTLPVYASLLQ